MLLLFFSTALLMLGCSSSFQWRGRVLNGILKSTIDQGSSHRAYQTGSKYQESSPYSIRLEKQRTWKPAEELRPTMHVFRCPSGSHVHECARIVRTSLLPLYACRPRHEVDDSSFEMHNRFLFHFWQTTSQLRWMILNWYSANNQVQDRGTNVVFVDWHSNFLSAQTRQFDPSWCCHIWIE